MIIISLTKVIYEDGKTPITAKNLNDIQDEILNHTGNDENPHGVTAEQVGARPNTWLPTIAEIGAAPGGYGLGEAKIFSMADIDNITKPGFYSSGESAIIGGFQTSRWWMLVKAYGNGTYFVTQEIYTFSGALGLKLERHKVNGNWLEWEWVNPPMVVGVEYRTTERYNGSPVYAKLVELGNLPNASTKDVQFTDDARNVFPISLETQIGSGVANLHTTQTDDMYINLVNYRYVRVVTSADRSNMVGRAIVKYYYK